MFARFGVGPDLLCSSAVGRVTDTEARERYGIRGLGDMAGIVFPYLDPITSYRVGARLRRDNPEIGADGEPKGKYISPYANNPHLYYPPGARLLTTDCTVPVVFIEAEKSSLALTALGTRNCRRLLAVATGGCWSWRGKVGIKTTATGGREEERGPLPDLSLIAWEQERLAIIVFDSNTASNLHVRAARWAFAHALDGFGAKVLFVDIPGEGDVNGPDDLIASAGDEAMLRLLDTPRPFAEQAEKDAEDAISQLSATTPFQARDAALDRIAAVSDIPHQQVLASRAAKALKEPKGAVDHEIGLRARATREAREQAKEFARQGRLLRMTIKPAFVIESLRQFFERRMHLREGASLLLALYVLNTWCFDLFETVPYLLLTSPLPQCGKTRLMNLLEAVCARARSWVSVSGASMFRTVELYRPTLLIDQVEKLAAVDESSRDIIAILDAGYKKGAHVPRMTGKNHDILAEFSVYCPKVLACVRKLKGALLDRCIINELERKPHGVKLESARTKAISNKAAELREACEAYAVQWKQELIRLYEEEPNEGYWPTLADREQELCGPLLLHARVAGIEEQALKVARAFSCRKLDIQGQELDFSLARELCEVLEEFKGERFSSKALLTQLEKKEFWGNRLAHAKNERAASTSIGTFVARFNLDLRKHDASGTTYDRAEAIKKISSYILQDLGVTGVKSTGTHSESSSCATDTSRESCAHDDAGVSPQAAETDRPDSRLTPLKPEIRERKGEGKSEADISTAQPIGTEQVGCRETPAAQENSGNGGNSRTRGAGAIDGILKF